MIKKNLLLWVLVSITYVGFSQEIYKGNVQINAGLNLLTSPEVRAPLTDIGRRLRGDLEVNYFLQDKFALGGGLDYVSSGLSRAAFSTGVRYYWLDQAFFRSKLHIPLDFNSFDVSMGVGYNYMLGDDFGLESNLDYYIKSESATFRFGIALFL